MSGELPVLSRDLPLCVHLRVINKYRSKVIQDDYDLILQWLNTVFSVNCTALVEFKRIERQVFVQDQAHHLDVTRQYVPHLEKALGIELSLPANQSDEAKAKPKSKPKSKSPASTQPIPMIRIIKQVIGAIDYNFKTSGRGTTMCYSIVRGPNLF